MNTAENPPDTAKYRHPAEHSSFQRFSFQHFSFTHIPLFPRNPLFPASGPATSSFNGLHRESNFLAIRFALAIAATFLLSLLPAYGTTFATVDFDNMTAGATSVAALNAATTGASWSLQTSRGANYTIQSSAGDKAFLMDDSNGGNDGNILFSTITLNAAVDITTTNLTWSFRTAAARTGTDKGLMFQFCDSAGKVAATSTWSEGNSVNLNNGQATGAVGFDFLGTWDPTNASVKSFLISLSGTEIYLAFGGTTLTGTVLNNATNIQSLRIYSTGSNTAPKGVFMDDLTVDDSIPVQKTVHCAVNTASPRWQISPYLVGTHIVYSSADDPLYADFRIADWQKRVGVSTCRYPGGTVVKYWDWEHPTGVLTGDPLDPSWNTNNNQAASAWMSLDEYLTFVARSGIRPLFGVNCLSEINFGSYTRQQGVNRAVRMVNYVKARGYGGALWYIGNEEVDTHGGVAAYAQDFKAYAEAMKAADPNILIFWNDNDADASRVKTFLNNDGGTADGLETHGKWPYGGDPNGLGPGTFDQWLVEIPLRDRKNNNRAWRDAADTYRAAAAEVGRGDLLMANNEYGIGKDGNFNGFNRYTTGLLLTEMLMDHFTGNWFSTCFWDMNLSSERGLIDRANSDRFNPFNFGMNMLADVQGGDYYDVSSSKPYVHGFAARKDGIWIVYLLNKMQSTQAVSITFSGTNPPAAFGRLMQNTADGYGELVSIPVQKQGATCTATLPALTFAELTFADPTKYLRVESLSPQAGKWRLRWKSIPGANFDVLTSTNLNNWQPAVTNIAPDNLWTETDLDPPDPVKAFFKVQIR